MPAARVASDVLPAMFGAALKAAGTWRRSGTPLSLHDLRVAARRYRAALRFFKPVLDQKQTRRVLKALDRLAAVSGPVRDTDVLEGLAPGIAGAGGGRAGERTALRRFLAGGGLRVLENEASRLHGICRAAHPSPTGPSIGNLVALRMRKRMANLLRSDLAERLDKPGRVHAMRKRTRRLRYWAEMAAPFCGRPMANLAARLHKAATALGELHDVDVAIGRRGDASYSLRRMRRRRMREVRSVWRALAQHEGHSRNLDALFPTGVRRQR